MKVTLIGTLLPIKYISPYCQRSPKSLSRRVEFEFIRFKKLYLDFLCSGGTRIKDYNHIVPEIKNAKVKNFLICYIHFLGCGVS